MDDVSSVVATIRITASNDAGGVFSEVSAQAQTMAAEVEAASTRANAALSGLGSTAGFGGLGAGAAGATAEVSAQFDTLVTTVESRVVAMASATVRGIRTAVLSGLSEVDGATQTMLGSLDEAIGGVTESATAAKLGLKDVDDEAGYAASSIAKITGAAEEAAAQIQAITPEVASVTAKMREMSGAMTGLPAAITGLSADFAALGREVGAVRDLIASLGTAGGTAAAGLSGATATMGADISGVDAEVRALIDNLGGSVNAAAEMGAGGVATATATMGADVESLTAKVEALQGKLDKLGAGRAAARAGGASQSYAPGSDLGTVGGALLTAGERIGLASAGASAFSLFEQGSIQHQVQAMAGSTNLSQAAEKEAQNFVLGLMQRGPIGAQDLTGGYLHAASIFPNDTQTQLQDIITAAWKSAVATDSSVNAVTDALARAMNAWGIGAKNAPLAMDVIHGIGARGDMTLQQLVQNMTRSASFASQLKIPLPTYGAMFDVLTRLFGPSQANTQLSGIESHLVAQSGPARTALAQLQQMTGIPLVSEVSDKGVQQYGVVTVLDDLFRAVGEIHGGGAASTTTNPAIARMLHAAGINPDVLNQAGKAGVSASGVQMLDAIFPGQRGLAGLLDLMSHIHGANGFAAINRYLGGSATGVGPMVGTGGQAQGQVQRLFDAMMGTTSAQFKTDLNQVRVAAFDIGNVLAPAALKAAAALTKLLMPVEQFVQQHPSETATAAEAGVGIGIGSFALKSLAGLVPPVAAGGRLLGQGGRALLDVLGFGPHMDLASATLARGGGRLADLIGAAGKTAGGFFSDMGGLEFLPALLPASFNSQMESSQTANIGGQEWGNLFSSLGAAVHAMLDGLKKDLGSFGDDVGQFFANLPGLMSQSVTAIKTFFSNLPSDAQTGLTNLTQAVSSSLDAMSSGVQARLATLKSALGTFFSDLPSDVESKWTAFLADIAAQWDGFQSALTAQWTGFTSRAAALWGTIATTAESAWDGLVSTLQSKWDGLQSAIESRWNDLKTLAESVFGGIASTVESKWTGLTANVQSALSGLQSDVTSRWNDLTALTASVWGTLETTVSTIAQTIWHAVVGFFTNLYDDLIGHSIIPDLVNGIVTWFTNLPGMLAGALGTLVSTVVQAASDLSSGFMAKLGSLKDQIATWIGDEAGAFLAAGTTFAQKIASGITGAAGDMKDALALAVTDAINAVKSLPVAGGLISALTGGARTAHAAGAPSGGGGGVFGLTGITGTVFQQENEGNLVGTSGYVNDRDYLLPYGAKENIDFPGNKNAVYTVLPGSGGTLGSNGGVSGIEMVQGPNGRFALLHLSQTVSPGTYHGGQYAGTTGWPTNPVYGNGVAGPGNAQLCVVYNGHGDPVALVPADMVRAKGGGAVDIQTGVAVVPGGSAPPGSIAYLAQQYGYRTSSPQSAAQIAAGLPGTFSADYQAIGALPQKLQNEYLPKLEALAAQYESDQATYLQKLNTDRQSYQQKVDASNAAYTEDLRHTLADQGIRDAAQQDKYIVSLDALNSKNAETTRHLLADYNIKQTKTNADYLTGLAVTYAKQAESGKSNGLVIAEAMRKFGISQSDAQALFAETLTHNANNLQLTAAKMHQDYGISVSEAKKILAEDLQHRQTMHQQALDKLAKTYDDERQKAKETFDGEVVKINEGLTKLGTTLTQLGSPDKLFQTEGQMYAQTLQQSTQAAAYLVEHGLSTVTTRTTTGGTLGRWNPLTGQWEAGTPGTTTTSTAASPAFQQLIQQAAAATLGQRGQALATADVKGQTDLLTGDLADFDSQLKATSTALDENLYRALLAGKPVQDAYMEGLVQITQAEQDLSQVTTGVDLTVQASLGSLSGMLKDTGSILSTAEEQWTQAVITGSAAQGQYTAQIVQAAQAQRAEQTATYDQQVALGMLTGDVKTLDAGLKGLQSQATDAENDFVEMLGRSSSGLSQNTQSFSALNSQVVSATENLGTIGDIVSGLKTAVDTAVSAAGTEIARGMAITPDVVAAYGGNVTAYLGAQADQASGAYQLARGIGDVTDALPALKSEIDLWTQKLQQDAKQYGDHSAQVQQDQATLASLNAEYTGLSNELKILSGDTSLSTQDVSAANAAYQQFVSSGIDPATAAFQQLQTTFPTTADALGQLAANGKTAAQQAQDLGTAAEGDVHPLKHLGSAVLDLAGAIAQAMARIAGAGGSSGKGSSSGGTATETQVGMIDPTTGKVVQVPLSYAQANGGAGGVLPSGSPYIGTGGPIGTGAGGHVTISGGYSASQGNITGNVVGSYQTGATVNGWINEGTLADGTVEWRNVTTGQSVELPQGQLPTAATGATTTTTPTSTPTTTSTTTPSGSVTLTPNTGSVAYSQGVTAGETNGALVNPYAPGTQAYVDWAAGQAAGAGSTKQGTAPTVPAATYGPTYTSQVYAPQPLPANTTYGTFTGPNGQATTGYMDANGVYHYDVQSNLTAAQINAGYAVGGFPSTTSPSASGLSPQSHWDPTLGRYVSSAVPVPLSPMLTSQGTPATADQLAALETYMQQQAYGAESADVAAAAQAEQYFAKTIAPLEARLQKDQALQDRHYSAARERTIVKDENELSTDLAHLTQIQSGAYAPDAITAAFGTKLAGLEETLNMDLAKDAVHPSASLERTIAKLEQEIAAANISLAAIKGSSGRTAKNTAKTASNTDPAALANALIKLMREIVKYDAVAGARMIGNALGGIDGLSDNFGTETLALGI